MTNSNPSVLKLMENWVSADRQMLNKIPLPKEYKDNRIYYDESLINLIRIFTAKGLCEDLLPAVGKLGTNYIAVQWLELKYKAELFVIIGSFISGVGEAVFIVAIILFIVNAIENKGKVDVFSLVCILLPFLRQIKCASPLVGKLNSLMKLKPKVSTPVQVNPFKVYNGKNVSSPIGANKPELAECVHEVLKECKQLTSKFSGHPQIKNMVAVIKKNIDDVINQINKPKSTINSQTTSLPKANKTVGGKLDINEANYYSGKSNFEILHEGDQIVRRYQIQSKPITNIGNPYSNMYSHLW